MSGLPWKQAARRLREHLQLADLHNARLQRELAEGESDLVAQVREARAHARRGDEAIRCVAEMIEQAHAAWTEHHGHMPPSAFASLQHWLRRDYVRIVRGEPRT
jgi:predicted  nucleic acid-binding Zn-ribbon protein